MPDTFSRHEKHEAKVEAAISIKVETGVGKLMSEATGKYDATVEASLKASYQFNYNEETKITCDFHMLDAAGSCAYLYQAYVEALVVSGDGDEAILSWDGNIFMHDQPVEHVVEKDMYPCQVFTDPQLTEIADITCKSVDGGWETKYDLVGLCSHVQGFPQEAYDRLKAMFKLSKKEHWESADACKQALKVIHVRV